MSTLESSTAWQRAGERARPRLSLQVSERRMMLVLGDVLTLTLAGAGGVMGLGPHAAIKRSPRVLSLIWGKVMSCWESRFWRLRLAYRSATWLEWKC